MIESRSETRSDRLRLAASRFRILYLAPVLALVALLAWALASPAGSSPDDDFHLTSIWCANSANTSACLQGDVIDERIVPSIIANSACYSRDPTLSGNCQAPFLAEGPEPSVQTARGSFIDNYPPLYYATMSIFVSPSILASVLVMRVVNILLFVGITSALFLLLPRERRPTLIGAWLISTVPLGLFLIASNNPSSWAIIGVGSAWLALLGYVESVGRRRVGLGVLFGLSALMAAGARGDAAIYVILGMVVVLILTAERTRSYLVTAILPVAVGIVCTLFFFGSRQSAVVSTGLGSTAEMASNSGGPLILLIKALVNVQSLFGGALGGWGLGWLDTALPAIVQFGAIIAFVGVAFMGLTVVDWRKAASLVFVGMALWLIPVFVLVQGHNVVGQNVQPRYLLPLMVLLAGVALITVRGRGWRFSWLQLGVVVFGLAVANSIALHTNLRRYVTGTDNQGLNLDANIEWWWPTAPSPMVVWVVGSIAYGALLLILVREMTKVDART